MLSGGFPLPENVARLIEGLHVALPVASTDLGTYETTTAVSAVRSTLAAESPQKAAEALALFEEHVDADRLLDAIDLHASAVVTPLMFEYGLLSRARAAGSGTSCCRRATTTACSRPPGIVLARDVAELTILGNEVQVRARALGLGIDLGRAHVISPITSPLRERFAETYARERAHKNVSLELARDTVTDVSYFGTLMVHLGLADGMVSGASHTTAHTIRPAFELIKTAPGVSVVSSVFLMALADRVLVYGDCAVIPDPTSEQLADIAISAAGTAEQFGIDPRVAMLSYSTGSSGSGADVEKVRAATALVRERAPRAARRGPDPVRRRRGPAGRRGEDARLARSPGRATVFVFPDLNTGNNTYKAVQRSSNALAIGPGAAGAEQADQRPVERRAGAGHRQHHRHHRHPGAEPRWCPHERRRLRPERRLLVAEVPAGRPGLGRRARLRHGRAHRRGRRRAPTTRRRSGRR